MRKKPSKNKDKLKKRRFIRFLFLIWTLWILFYSLIMYLQIGEIPYWAALLGAAYYNYMFAAFGVFIWWVCKKIPFETTWKPLFLLIHFTLAIFISALWLFCYYGLWYLAQGKMIFEIVGARQIVGWQFLFGNVQYFMVAALSYTNVFYQSYQKKKIAEVELQTLTREAELKALKLQINPHFLFNSLNSINALIGQNPAQARQMMTRLSDLLRMTLERHEKLMIPLREELDLVHTYLEIEQIRFVDKMVFREEIEPQLMTRPFPAMLLQPLLENAVKHGIANSRVGGAIKLEIRQSGNWLVTKIQNPVGTAQLKSSNNGGTGLLNVRARLDRMYGKNYSWEVVPDEAGNYTVTLKLPLEITS